MVQTRSQSRRLGTQNIVNFAQLPTKSRKTKTKKVVPKIIKKLPIPVFKKTNSINLRNFADISKDTMNTPSSSGQESDISGQWRGYSSSKKFATRRLFPEIAYSPVPSMSKKWNSDYNKENIDPRKLVHKTDKIPEFYQNDEIPEFYQHDDISPISSKNSSSEDD